MAIEIVLNKFASALVEGDSLVDGEIVQMNFLDGEFTINNRDCLTKKQANILAQSAVGLTTLRIAELRHKSEGSTKRQRQRINELLHVSSTIAAVNAAFDLDTFHTTKRPGHLGKLEPIEERILGLANTGITVSSIAQQVCYSESMIKDHLTAIRRKLGGVGTTIAAMTAARMSE